MWDEAAIIRQKGDKRGERQRLGKYKGWQEVKIEKSMRVARFGSLLERDRDWKAKKEPARADNSPEKPR